MPDFQLRTKTGKVFRLRDSDEIHRGGEGRILALPELPQKVAKIYHDGIAPISEKKFDFLSQLDKNLFVVPETLLFDSAGQVKGFVMSYLGQEFFPLSQIFSKNFCRKNALSEKFKRQIAKKLIAAVSYAHKKQMCIGDLNQYNILINKNATLKLIDTDSYQTPGNPHTNVLLDDIRDYLYGGKVSEKSDFFALSVLIFYAFTFTHPFKGIHKTHKTLESRMINRLPVFVNDSQLVVPKCYHPLADSVLLNQYSQLYLHGKRFLLSLEKAGAAISAPPPVQKITVLDEKQLRITPVLPKAEIIDMEFGQEKGYLETAQQFIVFSARNKGYLSEKFSLSKTLWDKIYLGGENLFLRRGESLFWYKSETEITKISNFCFPPQGVEHNYEGILLVVSQNSMIQLNLDRAYNDSVQSKRTEVFGKAFRHSGAIIQNVGGSPRIFYRRAKDTAIVRLSHNVKQIGQRAHVGIVQYLEKQSIKNAYFRIEGLNARLFPTDLDKMPEFALMQGAKNQEFVFEPADGEIRIRRTSDFEKTSGIAAPPITQESKLSYTPAGIVAWEDGKVFLLNRKK